MVSLYKLNTTFRHTSTMTRFSFVLILTMHMGCMSQDALYIEEIRNHRRETFEEFSKAETSPFKGEDLKDFSGLNYYEIDMRYKVTASFVRTPDEVVFEMKTSGERLPEYVKYGEYHFEMEGKKFKLSAYDNVRSTKENNGIQYVFIPFTDLTTGKETYGGGRFLEIDVPDSSVVELDLNLAFNPYCHYSDGYSCPIPPPDNFFDVEVRAGEKLYREDDH